MSPAQLLDRWDGIITEASQRFHVPKAWIRAVMRQESGGRTMLGEGAPMVSSAGAVGLMQLLPATYEEMAAQYKLGDNPFEPRDNIMAGAAYLRWLHPNMARRRCLPPTMPGQAGWRITSKGRAFPPKPAPISAESQRA